ncbi:MAG: iron chelate uptake ABC transporter family permease subunit, partial [Aquidulcibacter sp.]|uniref:iron chelate uptake ABC transporter family permease subunit n=1 Tax=Aquidulcibacter sp. TaxID=2052990 RepID=UPI0022BBD128
MKVQNHTPTLILTLVVLSVLALAASCLIGVTPLPLNRLLAAFVGAGDAQAELIVWEIRLPRAVAAFVVGMALAGSGA